MLAIPTALINDKAHLTRYYAALLEKVDGGVRLRQFAWRRRSGISAPLHGSKSNARLLPHLSVGINLEVIA
jgi:hypothetical protein